MFCTTCRAKITHTPSKTNGNACPFKLYRLKEPKKSEIRSKSHAYNVVTLRLRLRLRIVGVVFRFADFVKRVADTVHRNTDVGEDALVKGTCFVQYFCMIKRDRIVEEA